MIIYTAINIPYTAMLGVISPNPNERTTLSSIKFICAYAAGMVISATLLPLSKMLGGGSEQRGWQMAFMVVGAAVVGCFLLVFFNTKERISPPKEQKTSVGRDLKDLVTNGPWLILLGTTITFILFVAVRGSVTAHYFKYYVGTQEVALPFIGGTKTYSFEVLVSAFNTSSQVASLLGVFIVPFFAKAVGRKVAFITLFGIAVLSTASLWLVNPSHIWVIIGLNVLGSITGGPLSALIWAMYADTADYSEWKTGRRATGLIFSASIFSQKEGWAIGTVVSLGLLSMVGFKANFAQNSDTLNGLRMLMSLIPAGFGIISIVLVMFYPLNEKKVAEIGAELKARRERVDEAANVHA
jgi:GPH family glycoside/pentoside/hexuronide:cation symporter